jgi:hypothetical protein
MVPSIAVQEIALLVRRLGNIWSVIQEIEVESQSIPEWKDKILRSY